MTLTTLVGPSAVLISKEVLTTAGSYSRTPPAGASYAVIQGKGASGSGNIYPGRSATVFTGAGAFLQGTLPVTSSDSLSLVVGAGGQNYGAGSYYANGGGLTSMAKNGTILLIIAGGGSCYSTSGSPGTYVAGGGGLVNGGDGSYYDTYDGTVDASRQGGYGARSSVSGAVRGGDVCTGGQGYGNGGTAGGASGGGSCYFDSTLLYERTSPYNSDLNNCGVRQQSVNNVPVEGIDGGISITWYTGDPYAAGLLS